MLITLRILRVKRNILLGVTAQNKGTAAILVYQAHLLGIELYFYANILFCFIKPIWPLVT